MRTSISLIGLLLLNLSLISQIPLYDGTWMLGDYDPNTSSQVLGSYSVVINETSIDTNTVISAMTMGTNASICDSLGNLILYTNGVFIANGDHQIIEGGEFIMEGYYIDSSPVKAIWVPQGAMVIPKPNSSHNYYIYHIFVDTSDLLIESVKQLLRTEVDMSLNNGQGKVIDKAAVIIEEPLAPGNITACRHANGHDWWVVVPKRISGYYVLLEDGEGMPEIQENEEGPEFNYVDGQTSFSPDEGGFQG